MSYRVRALVERRLSTFRVLPPEPSPQPMVDGALHDAYLTLCERYPDLPARVAKARRGEWQEPWREFRWCDHCGAPMDPARDLKARFCNYKCRRRAHKIKMRQLRA